MPRAAQVVARHYPASVPPSLPPSRSSLEDLEGLEGLEGLVGLVSAEVAGRDAPRVAVLGLRPASPLVRELREGLVARGAQVSAIDVAGLPPERLHVWLAGRGPLDVVVDRSPDDVAQRVARTLFHVRPGGAYLVRATPDATSWVAGLEVQRASASPARPGDSRGAAERDRETLAWSVTSTGVAGDSLLLRHRAEVAATVREQQAARVLAARGHADDVLLTVPSAVLRSTAEVRVSPGSTASPVPSEIAAPELQLRLWEDVTCHAHQVALDEHLLLPASLPNRTTGRLAHPGLARWAPGFVGRPPAAEATGVPGTWYHLDNIKRGHFGHALSEQLSVTWGWDAAVAQFPDLGALVLGDTERGIPDWELALLEAAGVPRDRVRLEAGPVVVERLVTATPSFSRPDHVHPRAHEVYDRVGAALAARAEVDGPRSRRVFLTRDHTKRACRNAAEVEELHRRHGFAVVRPETLPLPEQVRLVRDAEVVAGFAGSGLFHVALTGGPRHVVVVGHEGYPAHNEQLFSAALGHRLDLVLARPDVPAGERFSRDAFHSSYAVDWDREGAWLRQVLEELG